ncbi:MAG: hypothetical protein GXO48_08185 [Chlorobi bacterium]|nr:hypothetical protein [Chlorobiota bacterium]
MIHFLVYLALLFLAVWTIWRFFVRNPLNRWAEERLKDVLRDNTDVKPPSDDPSIFDEGGTYVDYEDVK